MTGTARFLSFLCSLSVAVLVFSGPSGAAELAKPKGEVLLTLSGNVSNQNVGDKAEFDFDMLHALGVTKIETATAWTQGIKTFEGILLKTLVDAVGAEGSTAEVIALNDYKVDIPMKDFTDYPVILAYQMDGERLKIREKGPLWVVYPEDDNPKLKNKQTQAKWVWQVKEIHFK